MDERTREIIIDVNGNSRVIELDQGAMSEDEFIAYAIDYVLTYIQIDVI